MLAVVGALRHEVAQFDRQLWLRGSNRSPVLDSLRPVIEHSKDVDTNVDKDC